MHRTSRKQAIIGLGYVLCILVMLVIVYLVIQWGLGNISCSFGRFPGVQGRLLITDESLKNYPILVHNTEEFVHGIKKQFLASSLSHTQTIDRLNEEEGKDGQPIMMIATETVLDQKRGELLNTGRLGVNRHSCTSQSQNPYCYRHLGKKKGDNLWNYLAPDGTYEIREWLAVAREKGHGWLGSYWRNDQGNIIPKYTYILNIPGKNLILVSWFWANATIPPVH